MAEGAFYTDEARRRVADAIAEVESHTSAEVVVAVRRESGYYRYADYLFGFGTALATLCALLFLPQSFSVVWFPVDVAVGFAVGTAIGAHASPLRRLLSGQDHRRRFVRRAARAAFQELGISRTAGRTGVLVFVSLFERRIEVIRDVGVEIDWLGDEWASAVQRLQATMKPQPDFERFIEALLALGPLLGRVLERDDDDVNELPDTVDAA